MLMKCVNHVPGLKCKQCTRFVPSVSLGWSEAEPVVRSAFTKRAPLGAIELKTQNARTTQSPLAGLVS